MEYKLFDFIDSLTTKNSYLLDSPEAEADYSPFIVNRGMGKYMDCIAFAQEMNKLNCVTKEMHYDFFYYGITKKKRYAKWSKAGELNNNVVVISKYYNISLEKAASIIPLLTETQVQILENRLKAGGLEK